MSIGVFIVVVIVVPVLAVVAIWLIVCCFVCGYWSKHRNRQTRILPPPAVVGQQNYGYYDGQGNFVAGVAVGSQYPTVFTAAGSAVPPTTNPNNNARVPPSYDQIYPRQQTVVNSTPIKWRLILTS